MTNLPSNYRVVNISGGQIVDPMTVNPYGALSVPAYWRAVNFLSENLSSFGRSVRLNGAKRRPDEPAHPLDKLLQRRPNSYQNSFNFWRCLFASLVQHGNGYARISRAPVTFVPVALHNLPAEDVVPFRFVPDGEDTPVQMYAVRSTRTVLLGDDMLHLQGLGHDGQSGTDPIAMHAATFERADLIGRYVSRHLKCGTMVRGAIEFPAGVDKEKVAAALDVLQSFQGVDAERDVLLLSDGAKLNNAGLSPQESQLVEQAQHSTKQIAQLTNVPPEFLYELSEAKYNSSVEQAGQHVVRYVFRPLIEQCEDELSTKLLSTADQDAGWSVHINPDALLRGSTKDQADTVIALKTAGIQTENESRDRLGLPRIDDPEADKLKTLGDTAPVTKSAA
ncbi:MAG: phage portal protein [Tepidisphaeraceae bacterium]